MTTDDQLDGIRRIEDPLKRLVELASALTAAEQAAAEIRRLRDETIKESRAAGTSIPKIAAAANVSDTTVKSVLR